MINFKGLNKAFDGQRVSHWAHKNTGSDWDERIGGREKTANRKQKIEKKRRSLHVYFFWNKGFLVISQMLRSYTSAMVHGPGLYCFLYRIKRDYV